MPRVKRPPLEAFGVKPKPKREYMPADKRRRLAAIAAGQNEFSVWLAECQLTVEEAARLLGLSRSHAYALYRGYRSRNEEAMVPTIGTWALMGLVWASVQRGQRYIVVGVGDFAYQETTPTGWTIEHRRFAPLSETAESLIAKDDAARERANVEMDGDF